jgi:hypothetical protein
MVRVGEDDNGVWCYVPAATKARRGPDDHVVMAHGFLKLIPRGDWWTVDFFWDHPTLSCRVDIGTPCSWELGRVVRVDLDLAAVKQVDGSVEVLHADAFEQHRVERGYDRHLIDGAVEAAEEAASRLERGQEPFSRAARPWLAEVAG